jgi:N-hydroxyarylamine O-acetyltransferase
LSASAHNLVAMTTTRPPVDDSLRAAYLRRLGFTTQPPATVETLYALHRAQVERIPYESVWVWLGERRTIQPLDSIRYLLGGRGGYCYHQNGAIATLLSWLGFTVLWHMGGVQGHPDAKPNVGGNHLALTVTGLPSDTNPAGDWFIDAGLGDGPHEPMPLRTGAYTQGPHTYGLRPSTVASGGWRFEADPGMSLHAMDFLPGTTTADDLREQHEELQSGPNSSFVRTLVAFRRDATGVDFLRGRVLKRVGHNENTTELTTRADWYACLADVFALSLSDVDDSRKETLWEKVTTAHDEWLTTSASQ